MATYDLTSAVPEQIKTGDILNIPYSGAAKSITLPPGRYKLECWGAQGGDSYENTATGGLGGYSAGELTLAAAALLICYAGGQGSTGESSTVVSGGFNGGGNSGYNGGGSGGGASDIRIGEDSLYARVIVAGAGGGAGYLDADETGGNGGGTSGGNGGDGGTNGTDGTWEEAGVDGVDGIGGKVFSTTISINEQQSFDVVIGAGGVNGGSGGETTFGAYSGNSGRVFSPSYTDIASGDAFGRTGVVAPLDGTGDGGARGKGGVKGNKRIVTKREEDEEGNVITTWETVIDNYPENGTNGKNGADGFVVIYWDKEAEA